ncbi:serine/threonine-protein kinase [Streptomyces sp. NPDC048604]|uniref:serine/threonine-protein kinase n=1 Tax=Streptomyces sp. NPDC048604 TaxID=3365578 RepID=UPI0037165B6C
MSEQQWPVGGEGKVIGGRYRLGESLGRGGMGVVRRATDELLGRPVAVKELTLDGDADPARALREARAVARIRHPHVVVVHDVVEHEGRPAIVMELVDGGSLAERLARPGGTMSPEEAARAGLALLDALCAAHAHGVLHRDVKPANVLVEAGTGRVVLTDFGIASLPGTATTISGTGAFVGTPEYTAPERMQGAAADPAADLWSLGVLLCAAVAGESPFRRDSIAAVLHAVVFEEIRPSPKLGPLLPVVSGLLERDPQRRLGAEEARRLLAAVAAGTAPEPSPQAGASYTPTQRAVAPPTPPPPANSTDARDGRKGARAALVAAGAVAACAGAITAVLLLGDRWTGTDPVGKGAATATTTATATAQVTAPAPTTAVATRSNTPAPGSTAVPPGYKRVVDERGFSLIVPAAAERSEQGVRTFYITPDGTFRVGVKTGAIPPGGAEASMRAADAAGPKNNPGFRDNAITPTTHHGLSAVLWQFTWDGFDAGEGARHTYDLCWEENGWLYDVWVSGPAARAGETRAHFDKAVESFAPSAL